MDEAFLTDEQNAIVISVNPKSGSTDQTSLVDELAKQLKNHGFEVTISTDIEEVKTTAARLSHANPPRLRTVVAAGGDGTISLLASQLQPQTPISILPLGTENLLAKHLKLTKSVELLVQVIIDGRSVKLDAGIANGKPFLVMASCGFDAEVVQRLHSKRDGHIRHWSYASPIFNAIARYRYPEIRVHIDGQGEPIVGKWAFVFNVPRYAMNLPIVWDADPTDGRLDLCTFRGGNLLRGLFYLLAVLRRRHRNAKYSHHQRGRKLRLESDGNVPYQIDGDPGGVLPLEIETVPGFLNVLVPKSWPEDE